MKQRIYRNYFWVALTTILIVSFVFVFSYNRTIHDQKEEGMREEAEFISALLEKQGDADIGFQAAAGKTDFRITLIAENGMVLYDNKVKDVSGMENHAKRPEILKASKNGEGSSSRISSTIQSETYYYARKLSDGRYLRLSSKGLSIWSGFVQVLPALTGIALFVIFITFLIAHFLTRNIVEAINGIDLENPMWCQARSWLRKTSSRSYEHLSFYQVLFHLLADTGQPDGDVFLRNPYKLGYVLVAVGKPIAAHENDAVFDGQRVQKFLDDTG